jgi:hypothetical protein
MFIVFLFISFVFYLNSVSCEKTVINFWSGKTLQEKETFNLYNFKIVGLPNQCLNKLGSNFTIKFHKNLDARIELGKENNLYGIYYKDVLVRPKRHLEIFSPVSKNFTIALSERDMVNIQNEKSSEIDFIGEEFSFKAKLNNPILMENNITLPEITHSFNEGKVKACTQIDNDYMEAIRINFEVYTNFQVENIQKVCTNSNFNLNKKEEMCCEAPIPDSLKNMGVIR